MAFLDLLAVSPSPFLAVLPLLLISCWKLIFRNSRGLPYPPGPKGQLLIGNLHDLPTIKPWITYMNWGKLYGMSPTFSYNASDHSGI